jgi:hypothetical protein
MKAVVFSFILPGAVFVFSLVVTDLLYRHFTRGTR